jgi:serralysin
MTNAITPVIGTGNNDLLNGGSTGDVMSGRGGNDILTGFGGDDLIHGGGASDKIDGGTGNDVLFGGRGPSLLDMSKLVIADDYKGRITFLSEGAGFRNSLLMYSVAKDGRIGDVKVLFANASAAGSGGDLIGGVSAVDVPLKAGARLGFMIASNASGTATASLLSDKTGTFELRNPAGEIGSINDTGNLTLWHVSATGVRTAMKTQYGAATFHSAATPATGFALNPDRVGHTVGRVEAEKGSIVLGFEDLWNGGDRDFDDVIFRFDVGQSNARVLDPNLLYGESGEGNTWFWNDGGQRVTREGRVIAAENDTILGGTGSDKIQGGVDHDLLHGGDGDDEIFGNSGNDMIWGDSGADRLVGGKGQDSLKGGTGNDYLDGKSGNDALYGDDGDDTLEGASGADLLSGGNGSDKLRGGSGDDRLSGDIGYDTLEGGAGNDTLDGGAGHDLLEGGAGDDSLSGGTEDDMIKGGSGRDILYGGDGRDSLEGGEGKDILWGDAGADRLRGGSGDDLIVGGAGDDRLHGGTGNDIFAFGRDSGRDVISDFVAGKGAGDMMDLSAFGTAFDSFAEILAAARDVGGDAVISLDAATSITLTKVSIASLAADDFLFS